MVRKPTLLYLGPDGAALADRWDGNERAFDVVGVAIGDGPTDLDGRVDCAAVEPTDDSDATALLAAVREWAGSVPVVVVHRGEMPAVESILPDGARSQVTVPADADRVAVLAELSSLVAELAAERRERSMFDSLLTNVPVSVYFKDRDGRHVAVSDAMLDMIGPPYIENEEGKRHFHPADVVGKTDFDLYADDLAADTVTDDERVMAAEEPIENRVEHSWGERGLGTYVATSKAPWYDADGNVRGLVGITRDISERKRYEYQLQRQNERLRRFATMVSHDIRNPLSVALGRLEVARETDDPAHFEAIERSLDRIDSLVGDMLQVMRQGESVMDPDQVGLADAAERVWAAIDTGDATLRTPTVATVYAESGRLQVLLETLFQNAIEHGPGRGLDVDSVTRRRSDTPAVDEDGIEADSEDGARQPADMASDGAGAPVTITVGDLSDGDGFYVEDDGVGIPPDRRDEVFEPGLSAADTSDIGLSLVAAIGDAHNWRIHVTESASGGARFEFHGVRQLDD